MKIMTVTALISELYAENSKIVAISLCTSEFLASSCLLTCLCTCGNEVQ